MSQPLASIIVPNHNGAPVLDRCLRQLRAQDHDAFEIIVVDDASGDESVRVAERHLDGERLTIVRSERNRGLGAARNLGLRHARGRHIAYIDVDGFAAPDWLRQGVTRLECDPSLGAVASLVFFDGNRAVLNGAGATMNRFGYAEDHGFNEPLEYARLPREVVYAMGCGLIARREALERVGGFDPLLTNYYDDADLGLKLWRAGYRVELAPEAWIDHGFGQSGGHSPRKMLLCERHRIRVFLKHYPLRSIPGWLVREAASVAGFPSDERQRRREAWAWNLPRLPSTAFARIRGTRTGGLRPPFSRDSRPYRPVTDLNQPDPERAQTRLRMDGTSDLGALVYGFYAPVAEGELRFRWMAERGALLVRARRATRHLVLDYMVAIPDTQISLEIRPLDDRRCLWQGEVRAGAEPFTWTRADLPARVRAGTYVLTLAASQTSRPPDGAVLALGLTGVELR
ncbi:MAG: glycosyltransferase family 2 protein [Actinomycetota bacterium]|nr:glycosyltransferase family 2 protein [Actinomycetota bacterium]